MLNKDQSQEVGPGGLAIQAGGNVTVGVSVAEARSIAHDVAKLTFYELTGVARDVMSERVAEITEQVISRIEEEYPTGLRKAVDPDFQHALFTVQKHYGRTGDKDLGALLVDLLVDRSKLDDRGILQIVLNESLEVAPKLTTQQISNLAVGFLFRYTQNHGVKNDASLGAYFDEHVSPFVSALSKSPGSFRHLEFAGCGRVQLGGGALEDILLITYRALFCKGVEAEKLDADVFSPEYFSAELRSAFFMACPTDRAKIQVRAINEQTLKIMFDQHRLEEKFRAAITELFNSSIMTPVEVRAKCVGLRPYMETVFDFWSNSDMKSFTLTSVGLAIGHANIKRVIGREFADLSIWIN
jgi:hypothetical protein